MTQIYKVGTATVTNGSTTVAGIDAGWEVAGIDGGVFRQGGLSECIESFAVIEGVETITLAQPWAGPGGTGLYSIERQNSAAASVVNLYDRMRQATVTLMLSSVKPDGVGTLAQRDALDLALDQTQFIFHRMEDGEPEERYRWGGIEGWIGPFPVTVPGGAGDPGIGDRFDLGVFVQGKPRADEIVAIHTFSGTPITFPAGLALSRASAGVQAAASTVFSARKNGVQFATVTWPAAATVGVFACPVETIFSGGDVFTLLAPGVRDATLADIGATFAGSR